MYVWRLPLKMSQLGIFGCVTQHAKMRLYIVCEIILCILERPSDQPNPHFKGLLVVSPNRLERTLRLHRSWRGASQYFKMSCVSRTSYSLECPVHLVFFSVPSPADRWWKISSVSTSQIVPCQCPNSASLSLPTEWGLKVCLHETLLVKYGCSFATPQNNNMAMLWQASSDLDTHGLLTCTSVEKKRISAPILLIFVIIMLVSCFGKGRERKKMRSTVFCCRIRKCTTQYIASIIATVMLIHARSVCSWLPCQKIPLCFRGGEERKCFIIFVDFSGGKLHLILINERLFWDKLWTLLSGIHAREGWRQRWL